MSEQAVGTTVPGAGTSGAGPAGPSSGEAALVARELYRFFRAGGEETLALRGVSLRVRRGETVAEITGRRPALFRPPYGVMSGPARTATRRLGLTPVLWTCWGEDWTARAAPESVHRTVVTDLYGGGTVLLHDSDCTSAPGAWRSAPGALPRILDTCEQRGYEVGPLREHGSPGSPGLAPERPAPAAAPRAIP
ncbi:hypothetical protein OHB54_04610 [Streptomyces sp. NBC_01007]|nr:hypothetical protein OHB54_04610 [Streptomyces sp. NBC_01007]